MIPVILAIRDALCRHGLRSVLQDTDEIAVVAAVELAAELPAALAAHAPCVLVLDVALDEDGAFVPRLQAGWPGLRVLLFDADDERRPDERRSAAAGWLDRRAPPDELRAGVLRAGAGLERPAPSPRLTRRELEIAAAVAEGLDNRGIATRLRLREQTVKNHVSRIMAKLGTHSRVQLARWALEHHRYST